MPTLCCSKGFNSFFLHNSSSTLCNAENRWQPETCNLQLEIKLLIFNAGINGWLRVVSFPYSIACGGAVASWLARSSSVRAVLVRASGPVSRTSRKFFGPVKPFLVNLHLKTEKCTRLRLLV